VTTVSLKPRDGVVVGASAEASRRCVRWRPGFREVTLVRRLQSDATSRGSDSLRTRYGNTAEESESAADVLRRFLLVGPGEPAQAALEARHD
jgi:hypothetical protein